MRRYYLILPLIFAVVAVAAFSMNVPTADVPPASAPAATLPAATVPTTAVVRIARVKPARTKTVNDKTANALAEGAQNNVVVVVSSRSSVTSLTAEQTTKIFLGKVVTFPNGQAAIPIDQPEGSAVRDEFYTKVVHKNPSQLTAYWAKIIFTGDGRPPGLLPDSVAVRKAIAHDPNAIGYIEKSAVNRSVRVVLEP